MINPVFFHTSKEGLKTSFMNAINYHLTTINLKEEFNGAAFAEKHKTVFQKVILQDSIATRKGEITEKIEIKIPSLINSICEKINSCQDPFTFEDLSAKRLREIKILWKNSESILTMNELLNILTDRFSDFSPLVNVSTANILKNPMYSNYIFDIVLKLPQENLEMLAFITKMFNKALGPDALTDSVMMGYYIPIVFGSVNDKDKDTIDLAQKFLKSSHKLGYISDKIIFLSSYANQQIEEARQKTILGKVKAFKKRFSCTGNATK